MELVHELVSEQILLTESKTIIIGCVVSMLLLFSLRAILSQGLPGGRKVRGPMGIFLMGFNWLIDRVTNAYEAIVRLIVSRRILTMLIIGAFGYGILIENRVLPDGFIPLEDQGVIYGIIQTPPGSTLEYTNEKAHELQAVCRKIEDITSVTALAGYEILTEGRGSNAGTCLINLKPWADRKLTSKQIIEELEEKGREIANVKLEFFEPPAVPGFGAAGGFSLCLLDKTNSGNYDEFGKVT